MSVAGHGVKQTRLDRRPQVRGKLSVSNRVSTQNVVRRPSIIRIPTRLMVVSSPPSAFQVESAMTIAGWRGSRRTSAAATWSRRAEPSRTTAS